MQIMFPEKTKFVFAPARPRPTEPEFETTGDITPLTDTGFAMQEVITAKTHDSFPAPEDLDEFASLLRAFVDPLITDKADARAFTLYPLAARSGDNKRRAQPGGLSRWMALDIDSPKTITPGEWRPNKALTVQALQEQGWGVVSHDTPTADRFRLFLMLDTALTPDEMALATAVVNDMLCKSLGQDTIYLDSRCLEGMNASNLWFAPMAGAKVVISYGEEISWSTLSEYAEQMGVAVGTKAAGPGQVLQLPLDSSMPAMGLLLKDAGFPFVGQTASGGFAFGPNADGYSFCQMRDGYPRNADTKNSHKGTDCEIHHPTTGSGGFSCFHDKCGGDEARVGVLKYLAGLSVAAPPVVIPTAPDELSDASVASALPAWQKPESIEFKMATADAKNTAHDKAENLLRALEKAGLAFAHPSGKTSGHSFELYLEGSHEPLQQSAVLSWLQANLAQLVEVTTSENNQPIADLTEQSAKLFRNHLILARSVPELAAKMLPVAIPTRRALQLTSHGAIVAPGRFKTPDGVYVVQSDASVESPFKTHEAELPPGYSRTEALWDYGILEARLTADLQLPGGDEARASIMSIVFSSLFAKTDLLRAPIPAFIGVGHRHADGHNGAGTGKSATTTAACKIGAAAAPAYGTLSSPAAASEQSADFQFAAAFGGAEGVVLYDDVNLAHLNGAKTLYTLVTSLEPVNVRTKGAGQNTVALVGGKLVVISANLTGTGTATEALCSDMSRRSIMVEFGILGDSIPAETRDFFAGVTGGGVDYFRELSLVAHRIGQWWVSRSAAYRAESNVGLGSIPSFEAWSALVGGLIKNLSGVCLPQVHRRSELARKEVRVAVIADRRAMDAEEGHLVWAAWAEMGAEGKRNPRPGGIGKFLEEQGEELSQKLTPRRLMTILRAAGKVEGVDFRIGVGNKLCGPE